MEPKKLYGAALTRKTNRLPETYQQRVMREAMWEGLGMTPEELGERLRLALDTAVEKLEAMETQYFSHEGKVTDARMVAYHKAQLKAVRGVQRLIRGLGKMEAKPRPVSVHVNVVHV
jgi:hypothetical protein